jgi:hypothetical protein
MAALERRNLINIKQDFPDDRRPLLAIVPSLH